MKVHAQRKFAQGCNTNSPNLTPIREIERQEARPMPEPIELLPIKRPHTEDFLTFLCFRGTPILPPNLNFFNTASIVDPNGQIVEMKAESPKNGPIDTTNICKVSGNSERPFVAFGVRKRADPIVVSRQMDKKRRHALALQALRRKYQEQKMAKIRAVSISKQSEKSFNNSNGKIAANIKNECNTIQPSSIQVPLPISATAEEEKVITSPMRRNLKQKMCLRSFRGKFVHKELKFLSIKKRILPVKKIMTKKCKNGTNICIKMKEQLLNKDKHLSLSTNTVTVTKNPDIRVTRSKKLLHTNHNNTLMIKAKRNAFLKKSQNNMSKVQSLRSHKLTVRNKINERNEKLHLKQKSSLISNVNSMNPKGPSTIKEVTKKKVDQNSKNNTKCSIISTRSQMKTNTKDVPKTSDVNSSEMEKKVNNGIEQTSHNVNEKSEPILRRPTRKTKEAAAIYMELLSQKLVHENIFDDDDSISLDSFPELPNVKRIEQRENELKAKAKTFKTDKKSTNEKVEKKKSNSSKNVVGKSKEESSTISTQNIEKDSTIGILTRNNKEAANQLKESKHIHARSENEGIKTRSSKKQTNCTTKKENDDLKVSSHQSTSFSHKTDTLKHSNLKGEKISIRKSKRERKKSTKIIESEFSSDTSFKTNEGKTAIRKSKRERKKSIKIIETDYSSDISYKSIEEKSSSQHSTNKKMSIKSNLRKSLRNTKNVIESSDSSDSVSSTKSSLSKKSESKICTRSKTKIKTTRKSFSDSDEEPLSKLTQNVSKPKPKKDVSVATNNTEHCKPKRECAKRPQNYLPMFSSSDDEDTIICSFSLKSEPKSKDPVISSPNPIILTKDLSCKDLGRRFGKGKVNMSTEQIEKWLNDAALAENIAKKEHHTNELSENIPTQTSLDLSSNIDINQLRSTLLNDNCFTLQDKKSKTDFLHESKTSPETESNKSLDKAKTSSSEKKIIFRKHKSNIPIPNINAFSVCNESSVYAFGEESEDAMKTPFRRPSRRPSSTATSRSEDDLSKSEELCRYTAFRKPSTSGLSRFDEKDSIDIDDASEHCFELPLPKSYDKGKSLDKLNNITHTKLAEVKKATSRLNELNDDHKYKIPSSPSASSSSSSKPYKRKDNLKSKVRGLHFSPIPVTEFPSERCVPSLVEAPTFYPTEKQFQDPLEYIESIRVKAEQFGICRIVPPTTFKPECKISDDMRFTAYNQYVHKMMQRWGPNVKEFMAIKRYLSTQNISLIHPPLIGGMEVDLPRLYQTVQSLGGLKDVIEKKRWSKVSDIMKIPKSAQDRVTKLDDIYCKYLLPYDTLSHTEREQLLNNVEIEWNKHECQSLQQNLSNSSRTDDIESDDDGSDECIIRGKSMALNAFYRIARNTMSMWFKTSEPSATEVEQEFWKHVSEKQFHICVHSGSIDSGSWGCGFSVSKNSPFARHQWNLKVLTNNNASILRFLGPVMGVTIPTMHVGMVFSACCWYRDPHSLPWIEYLHTGGHKIWYGVPHSASTMFHAAMKKLIPQYCRDKGFWLPSDTTMVPPALLIKNGVSLSRVVQEPGQFIIIFPKAFTSNLATGYVVSESVYFAPHDWLNKSCGIFTELINNCEPSMFSLEKLLMNIATDGRPSMEILQQILPMIEKVYTEELTKRNNIKSLGIVNLEKMPAPSIANKKKKPQEEAEYECDICRKNLFLSVVEFQNDETFCLDHAISELEAKKLENKQCKLMYTYDEKDFVDIMGKLKASIAQKLEKISTK